MSRYAIAYDVSNDGVRTRIRNLCRKYGARQQYSLFEVRLSPTAQAEMVDELKQIADEADTERLHIRIYSVGPETDDINIPESANNTDNEPANIV